MQIMQSFLEKYKEWKGKSEVVSRSYINYSDELSCAYIPGFAQPCLEIQKDASLSHELTHHNNIVVVFSTVHPWQDWVTYDLLQEWLLWKVFSLSFYGINREDIAARRCFKMEAKLKESPDIPLLHDNHMAQLSL